MLINANIAEMGEYGRETENFMGFDLIVTNGIIVRTLSCDSDACSKCAAWTWTISPCFILTLLLS